jgi:hypothetical protein
LATGSHMGLFDPSRCCPSPRLSPSHPIMPVFADEMFSKEKVLGVVRVNFELLNENVKQERK